MNKYQLITSKDNRIFKLVKGLSYAKQRKETGLFLAEGYRLVRELVAAGSDPEFFVYSQSFAASSQGQELGEGLNGSQLFVFSDSLFAKLAETVNPQGVLAAFRIPSIAPGSIWHSGPNGKSYVLCLDHVQDPGNLGTIIRTASAFGYTMVLSRGCVDPYNPKVVRSSMGEIAKVQFLTDIDLVAFLDSAPDLPIIITNPHGQRSLLAVDTTDGCILVIGNEANGVSSEVEKFVGRSFYIPMVGQAESLNAAVATGIAVFETVRAHFCTELSRPNPI